MPKKLPLVLLILIVGGIFVLGGGSKLLNEFSKNFSASFNLNLGQDNNNSSQIHSSEYSFSLDDDKDGLSNAKEMIYETDPQKKDTDNDGYSDGEEIKTGFDPTLPGSKKITENPKYERSLTIKYFQWAKEQTQSDDPQIEINLALEFLKNEYRNHGLLPEISDSEIQIAPENTDEAVKNYFQQIELIPLPENNTSYFEIASQVAEGNTRNLEKAVNQIGFVGSQYKLVPVPPRLIDLHKKYIGSLKVLEQMFLNLYTSKKDPVRLIYDLKLSNELMETGKELENQKQEILSTL